MLTTKSRHWNRTVLDLAVQSHLLRFCEHRYCQLLCDEILRGNMDFGVSTVLHNSLNGPKAGLYGALSIIAHGIAPIPYPGALTLVGLRDVDPGHSAAEPDSIFAIGWVKRQTAFVTDKEREQDRKEGRHEQLTMAKYYQIPLVRQLLRLFFYFCFMCLYSYIVIQPKVWPVEGHGGEDMRPVYCLTVWVFSLMMDEWYKYAQDPTTFDFSFWVKYDWTVIGLTMTSLAVFTLHAPHIAMEIMKPASVLVWCRMLKFLQLSKEIGVLVIIKPPDSLRFPLIPSESL